MLTRGQVARRLGKSVATVRRMEGDSLHPEVNDNGVHLFKEAEVEEVAEKVRKTGRALPEGAADEIEASEYEIKHLKEMLDATEFQLESVRKKLTEERLQRERWQLTAQSAESQGKSKDRRLLRELDDAVSALIDRIERPDSYTVAVAQRVDQCIRGLSS